MIVVVIVLQIVCQYLPVASARHFRPWRRMATSLLFASKTQNKNLVSKNKFSSPAIIQNLSICLALWVNNTQSAYRDQRQKLLKVDDRSECGAAAISAFVKSAPNFLLAAASRTKEGVHITCLNRLMTGTEPSVLSISRVHSLAVLAPRGNRFRSSVMEPRKSSCKNREG